MNILIILFLLTASDCLSKNRSSCHNINKNICVINNTPGQEQVLNEVVDRIDNSELFRAGRTQCLGKTVYIPRSIGANTTRELLGWQDFIHTCNIIGHGITFAQSIGYAQSFKPEQLARSLFGTDEIIFSGSQSLLRKPCDWVADYFGLPTTFNGSLKLRPIIKNVILDTEFFFALDNLACGLYARIHAPIGYTKWDLGAQEFTCTSTISSFPSCYMSSNITPAICNLQEALSRNNTFGQMKNPRQFGNIPFKTLSKVKLADIDFILGFDHKCPGYHVGLYAQLVAPTGNKANPKFVFDPIVGNGGYTEFGAGISASLILWQTPCDTCFKIYAEGNITHLFENKQCRSFDLCANGPFSRYLLLKEFASDGITYTGNLTSAINVTTLPVRVSVPVKGDITVKFAYKTCFFDLDFGYNFYGRTSERLRLQDKCLAGNYGIKGNSGTCYNVYNLIGSPAQFDSLINSQSLNATNSNAKINCTGSIDNPNTPVIASNTIATAWNNARITGPATGNDLVLASTSNPPVLLSIDDLNLCSGTACPFATHKVFAYFGYTFDANACIKSFVGIAGEVEFEALADNEKSSLNQWALYVKFGVAF